MKSWLKRILTLSDYITMVLVVPMIIPSYLFPLSLDVEPCIIEHCDFNLWYMWQVFSGVIRTLPKLCLELCIFFLYIYKKKLINLLLTSMVFFATGSVSNTHSYFPPELVVILSKLPREKDIKMGGGEDLIILIILDWPRVCFSLWTFPSST